MKLYTASQAAKMLGVHKRTIDRYRADGKLIPAQKTLGGHSRYTEQQIEEIKNKVPENKFEDLLS